MTLCTNTLRLLRAQGVRQLHLLVLLSCILASLLCILTGFEARLGVGPLLWASAHAEARHFRVLGLFDGHALLPNDSSLLARLEYETLIERLLRLLPRSAAERRFKRKTALGKRGTLVMNAALILRTSSGSYTTNVRKLSGDVQLLLAFRASLTEQGPSDLYLIFLDASFVPLGNARQLSRARKVGGTWYGPPWREDPRFFVVGNTTLGVSYTVTSAYERNRHAYQVWQRQAYALLDTDLNRKVSDVFLSYGNNAEFVTTAFPTFEKNWLFFSMGDVLHAVYSVQPFVLLRVPDLLQAHPIAHLNWQHNFTRHHGQLRGSAPPVKVGEFWFIFAHSAAYAVFVMVLSADARTPMFVTKVPIISASEQLFVCGAVFLQDTQEWLLSAGVKDRQVILVAIPHAHVVSKLSPVKLETGKDTGGLRT